MRLRSARSRLRLAARVLFAVLSAAASVATASCGKAFQSADEPEAGSSDAAGDASLDVAVADAPSSDAVTIVDAADASDGSSCDLAKLASDPKNCGSCGNVCSTAACTSGLCDRLVFATSATSTGNLGGLAGADATCQSAAIAAGVKGPFKAWLSDNLGGTAGSPAGRFVHGDRPYRRRDGTVVAMSYAQLVADQSLAAAIDRTETGAVLAAPAFAWTDTSPTGNANGTNDCGGWTSSTSSGNSGDLTRSDFGWTTAASRTCDMTGHLICFEQ